MVAWNAVTAAFAGLDDIKSPVNLVASEKLTLPLRTTIFQLFKLTRFR